MEKIPRLARNRLRNLNLLPVFDHELSILYDMFYRVDSQVIDKGGVIWSITEAHNSDDNRHTGHDTYCHR